MTSKKSTSFRPDKSLLLLAFDNSGQANLIITVKNGNVIAANTAACKLLGYSKKELLTINRSSLFLIEESDFEKMLMQRTTNGQFSGALTVVKKRGRKITCNITSVIFIDDAGVQNAITTIVDMSKAILVQKNIDIANRKVVAADIIRNKINQKHIDVKNRKVVAQDIFIAKLKQKDLDEKNEVIIAENIKLADEKSDARLEENNQWIKYIAKNSYDVMWDWDIATGEIYVGDSIEEVFGYKVKNNIVNFVHFEKCILPEVKESIINKINSILASNSKDWDDSFLFKRRDGSVAFTTSRASIVRDQDGKAIRLIGAIHDISREQELENKLKGNIDVETSADRNLPTNANICDNDGFAESEQLSGDNKTLLTERIKQVIVQLFHHTDEQPETNFSDFLSEKLQYDYTYLSNLFSETEGIPIRQFVILQKIARVKELILKTELTLTQIAFKLHYSSIAHLSNQFKKVTGITPSYFRETQLKASTPL